MLIRSRRRFIPAGAGNTRPGARAHCCGAVHPRGRGEHELMPVGSGTVPGSSPRARGTHMRSAVGMAIRRFIPAGAGNTRPGARAHCCGAVHPRGRGEHELMPVGSGTVPGSSPRARGTHMRSAVGMAIRRFIPAGAGNTHRFLRFCPPLPVHPRGRGEHQSSRRFC